MAESEARCLVKCTLMNQRRRCRAENPLTEAQLDEAIEAHLAAKFGEKLDFALEAAVPTLLQDGLVSRDGKVPCISGFIL